MFTKVGQNVAKAVFYIQREVFKLAQTVAQYLGNFVR